MAVVFNLNNNSIQMSNANLIMSNSKSENPQKANGYGDKAERKRDENQIQVIIIIKFRSIVQGQVARDKTLQWSPPTALEENHARLSHEVLESYVGLLDATLTVMAISWIG